MSAAEEQLAALSEGEDPRSLATSLAPQLERTCDGRLSDLRWFRTDWQRGGAATGTARFREPTEDRELDVVVKLPVSTRELVWIRRLQDPADDAVVPHLVAGDSELGGYDLAWVIIERFPHGPLGGRWHEDHIERIAAAAARFHCRADAHPVDRAPRFEDWPALLDDAGRALRDNRVRGKKQWTAALRRLGKGLDEMVERWRARRPIGWLHGDLHLANAMSRTSLTEGPVSLIDLAEVRPGHWVEDAVYLERQLWSRPERLQGHSPVRAIARARKAEGLDNGKEYQHLAAIRRALLAGTAPAFLRSEGSPAHLAACLQQLERALGQLS